MTACPPLRMSSPIFAWLIELRLAQHRRSQSKNAKVTFFPITQRVHPQAIDRGKSVFTFGMDQKAMYDYLDDSPSAASWPVDYVNDPRIIAQNDNVISINATIEIDLIRVCPFEESASEQHRNLPN
jgi:Acetyl-CoA hydrolase/transferase C-terminal domain